MPTDKAVLARTRNNQRRSRARKKEYLQDVETKLRQCELLGVQASTEVQLAARQVATENRKLRELLISKGVPPELINAYVQSDHVGDGSIEVIKSEGRAVQLLQRSLSQRECRPGGKACNSSRDGSSDCRPEGFSDCGISKINARSMSVPQRGAGPISPSNVNSIHPRPLNRTSLGHVPTPFAGAVLEESPNINQQNLSLGEQTLDVPHQLSSQSWVRPSPSVGFEDDVAKPGGCGSCTAATDMISSMLGGDPAAIRTELGCGPEVECEVDHNLTFSLIDRYSGSTNFGL